MAYIVLTSLPNVTVGTQVVQVSGVSPTTAPYLYSAPIPDAGLLIGMGTFVVMVFDKPDSNTIALFPNGATLTLSFAYDLADFATAQVLISSVQVSPNLFVTARLLTSVIPPALLNERGPYLSLPQGVQIMTTSVNVTDPTTPSQQQAVDASGNASVKVNVALPAGTNVIGHVIVDSAGAVSVTSLPTLPAGTNVIGHVIVDSGTVTVNALPTGTNTIGGVKLIDTGGTNVGAIDASGNLSTKLGVALPAGTNVIGHIIADSGSTTVVTSLPALPAGTNVIGHIIVDSGTITATTNADTTIGGTTAPSKELLVAGKTNDGTAQYQPLPEGAGGRSVIVEGYAGGTAVPVSGTVTANPGTGNYQTQLVDSAGTNVAGVDASHNVLTKVNAALPAGTNVIGHVIADSGSTTAATQATAASLNATATIQAVTGTSLVADQANSELRVSSYGKNSTAGDTALQLDSDGSQYMDLRRVGGVTTQMGTSDGVNQANIMEHVLGVYNSGGPVDSTGKPQQLSFDRWRTYQGKAVAGSSGNITATVAGDTALAFGSAPKTIMPGQAIQLSIGAGNGVETVYVTSSFTPSSSATSIPLQTPVVNANSTTAKWDVFAPLGSASAVMLPTGVPVVAMAVQDPAGAGQLMVVSGGSADAQGSQKFLGVIQEAIGNSALAERQRLNLDNISLVASAAYTTTQTSADQTNYSGRGVIVVLDTTVASAGSVTLEIDGKDPVSGKYYSLLTGTAVTTVSTNVYTVYPAAPATANVSANSPLPRTWRVKVTANNASTQTYSVGVSVIV